jgi:hypothetical protein
LAGCAARRNDTGGPENAPGLAESLQSGYAEVFVPMQNGLTKLTNPAKGVARVTREARVIGSMPKVAAVTFKRLFECHAPNCW